MSVLAFGLAAGAVFTAATNNGWVHPGQASLAVWVVLAALTGSCLNFMSIVPYFIWSGQTLRGMLRGMLVPVLAVEISGAAIAGATAHAYYTVGFGALLAFGGVLVIIGVLLAQLSAGERSSVALDESLRERDELSRQLVSAEERARRALAADLHDDALQLLAVARHDLEDGAVDRVEERLNEVDASLRDLLVRLDAFGTRTTVPAAFEELVATIGGRSGLSIRCTLDPALTQTVDADLVSCARELLLNAEKHANATRVWITADPGRLTVADDGRGGRIDIPAALDSGHVGLALVAQRAHDRDGDLTFQSRPEGGLQATVTFRRAGDDPAPRDARPAARADAGARSP